MRYTVLLATLILLTALSAHGQGLNDVIISKDSTRIKCRITSIDTNRIYMDMWARSVLVKTSIVRKNVLEYYWKSKGQGNPNLILKKSVRTREQSLVNMANLILPTLSDKNLKVVVISDKIGEEISPLENKTFKIVRPFSSRKFVSAKLFLKEDSTMCLAVWKKDGSVAVKVVSSYWLSHNKKRIAKGKLEIPGRKERRTGVVLLSAAPFAFVSSIAILFSGEVRTGVALLYGSIAALPAGLFMIIHGGTKKRKYKKLLRMREEERNIKEEQKRFKK